MAILTQFMLINRATSTMGIALNIIQINPIMRKALPSTMFQLIIQIMKNIMAAVDMAEVATARTMITAIQDRITT
jgi:hypothetical protein